MVEAIRGYGPAARGAARTGAVRERFRLPAGEAGPAQAAAAVAPAGGLLALQSTLSDAERNAAAARRGGALLAELDALQRGLLAGRVAPAALRRLAALTEGEAGADPALREIVEGLALRARVEVARLGT
ncbi:MAG: flagellar assembly protein FliX [Rubritepida sp.]|nr:flagellar assembly protein FliX [Rubritepida sp.]